MTEGQTDQLQELLELLFATKNVLYITMAERRMTVLARLTLTALRSALLLGLPSITLILGRLESRPHSLHKLVKIQHQKMSDLLLDELHVGEDDDVPQVVVGDV